jgi:hypothetical protein
MGGPPSSFVVTTKEPPEHPNGKGDLSYPATGMVRSQSNKAEGEAWLWEHTLQRAGRWIDPVKKNRPSARFPSG